MSKGKKLFIGIDAGTTFVKSVLFDEDGKELNVAQKSVPVESPKSGFQEMDMNKVWDAAKETLKNLLIKADVDRDNIVSVGVTGQGCGCWLIDEEGVPVRNAILWSDTRAVDIVNQWVENGTSEEIYKICGSDQFSGAQGAVIKWLSENEPESLKKARYALYCKDWIKYKLTGIINTEASEASISYFDQFEWQYSSKIFGLMDIKEYVYLLPEIRPGSEVTGTVLPNIADELGLPLNVKVAGSAFDISASAVGAGAISSGDACTIIGTALITEVVIDKPLIKPLNVGFTIPLGIPDHWVRMLNTKLGTPNLDWFLKNYCHEDYKKAEELNTDIFDYIEENIKKIPIGADGVIYTPFISAPGVRAPFLDANSKAQFIGLSPEHSRYHLLRALFEGIALSIKLNYKEIPQNVESVILSGGGSRSSLWCQIIADALNVVVKVPVGSEFGAKGAAINAAVAAGYYVSYKEAVENLVRYERVYKPDYGNFEKYNELFPIFKQVYSKMSETWELLTLFTHK